MPSSRDSNSYGTGDEEMQTEHANGQKLISLLAQVHSLSDLWPEQNYRILLIWLGPRAACRAIILKKAAEITRHEAYMPLRDRTVRLYPLFHTVPMADVPIHSISTDRGVRFTSAALTIEDRWPNDDLWNRQTAEITLVSGKKNVCGEQSWL